MTLNTVNMTEDRFFVSVYKYASKTYQILSRPKTEEDMMTIRHDLDKSLHLSWPDFTL